MTRIRFCALHIFRHLINTWTARTVHASDNSSAKNGEQYRACENGLLGRMPTFRDFWLPKPKVGHENLILLMKGRCEAAETDRVHPLSAVSFERVSKCLLHGWAAVVRHTGQRCANIT